MIILGLDPGIATTGYAIINSSHTNLKLLDYGCILTDKKSSEAERLHQISKDLTQIIKTHNPDKASIEKIFFNTNIKTAITVAQARGVLLMTLEKYKIPLIEFTPPQIKSTITGYGKADKKMVQSMLMKMLNIKIAPHPDDASDAIATAICLANTNNLQ